MKKHGKGRERWNVANWLCRFVGHGPYRAVAIHDISFAECRKCRVILRPSHCEPRRVPYFWQKDAA